ncbi:MAG: porin family protein [Chlorobium phaeobacteroides]|jgi:opacity protein-like surface antigen|nr:porin family protein [Chlorobium phaeobacteroides]
MKKVLMSLFVAGMCAAPAYAAGPYVSASAGLGLLGNSDFKGVVEVEDVIEYNSGLVLNGAVGYDADMFRGEFAVGYQSNGVDTLGGVSIDNVDVSILSFMANAYVDFEMKDSALTPYLMAGLGLASVDFSDDGGDDFEAESVFAWQIGAGIGVKAADNLTVDLGYRYFVPSDVEIDDVDKITLASSNIMLGLRYGF